jgi:hypothetical protein
MGPNWCVATPHVGTVVSFSSAVKYLVVLRKGDQCFLTPLMLAGFLRRSLSLLLVL